jgi:purine-nucleoside phosphorylase
MPTPIHILPTAELAPRVLLPGDPGRAMRLAQQLIAEPKMFNHNRGLWGYTGPALLDGELLTVQATGMGGPSTAIVASELIELGAERLLRVGTCGGLDPALELGTLLVASEAIGDDGTSRALAMLDPPQGDRFPASPALLDALLKSGAASGSVVSSDLFYDADDRHQRWRDAGARAVEMEAATLFILAERRQVEAGCALLVSDTLTGAPIRIDNDALHRAELALGELAVNALAAG